MPVLTANTNIPPTTNTVAVTALEKPSVPEELPTIETPEARYTFTSYGGGLKHIELKEYQESVTCESKKKPGSLAALNKLGSVPVLALLGDASIQGDGVYQLTKTTNGGMRAEKQLPSGLVVIKQFQPTTNFLVAFTLRFENRSPNPVNVPAHQVMVGTAAPVGLDEDPNYLGVYWYNAADKKDKHVDQSYFANKTLGCFPGTPRTEYRQTVPIGWAAAHDQFFTLALMPKDPAPELVILHTNLPPPTAEQRAANPKALAKPFGFQTSLVYPAISVAANQAVERQFDLYAGPKEYRTLVRIDQAKKNDIDLVMDYDGFFGWFAQVLLSSMNGLNKLGTALLAGHRRHHRHHQAPLLAAHQRQHEVDEAHGRAAAADEGHPGEVQGRPGEDEPQGHGVHEGAPRESVGRLPAHAPADAGVLRIFPHDPQRHRTARRGVLLGLRSFEARHHRIHPVPEFPVNPLPLVMGATMLWQARLTPVAPGMDPMQQNIMKYMPLMFLFILYNFSAGLTLYWTVQNLLTIAQMKLTKAKDEPKAPATPAKPAAPAPSPPRKKK